LDRRFDVVTFDCYGTLIDWEAGIGEAFLRAASSDGFPLDPSEALHAYAEIEPMVEAESFRRYRDVLAETALRVATRLGWRLAASSAGFLADSLPDWRPFPDTNPALQRLAAAGYRLGILSNVDDDLLAGTRRHLTARFDLLVTAEQVRSYKPGHAHFLGARERISGARWLHAAQSKRHDVLPALALGIPIAWVNRKGESRAPEKPPDAEVRDLAGLVEWLEAGS
jgi:2-haloacid dehalogenase/putative hydrolase of the HAD superfamily